MDDYYSNSSAIIFISKEIKRGKSTTHTLDENKPQCCLAAFGNKKYCII